MLSKKLEFVFFFIILIWLSKFLLNKDIKLKTFLLFNFPGPKFQAEEKRYFFLCNLFNKIKYPYNGSITCCQGLLEFDDLKNNFLFLSDLKKSGTILSLEKSPPPITLPALQDATKIFFF